MVNLTIDGISVSVPEGTTIMEAAAQAGLQVPHLCYWKGLNEIGACRVCAVEVEGFNRLVTACNTPVSEGLSVRINSRKARVARKHTVEMILSEHDCSCPTCERSGDCALRKIANDLNIKQDTYSKSLEYQPWPKDFPLIKDSAKCVKCMRCVQVCDKIQGIGIWDVEGTGSRTTVNVAALRDITSSECVLCGQCITHCPVGALKERDDIGKLFDAIEDPDKTVVVQVAPAVRAAWGEGLGLSREEATVGKIFDALKKLGADYVFDTSFAADLTIMEEANEFIERYTKGELAKYPMFTSCCPGWVRYIKSRHPELVGQLSTAKSPMQMFGAVMKTYFSEHLGKNPEDIVSVAIMPCLAKKDEAGRPVLTGYADADTDIVLTTRELDRMIKSSPIVPALLKDAEPDRLFGAYSGAGVIFGATGGVMEAALRTAYFKIKGENPEPGAFAPVRASSDEMGVQAAEFSIGDIKLKVAAVSGLANTERLLKKIISGEEKYDFVEVMACPGGCAGGGGQPHADGYEPAYTRGKNLYFLDASSQIRYSHMNPDIWDLYNGYFGEPLSHKAHELLHTDHKSWEMIPAARH